MCELFAMSASYPAAAEFCMREFASHGGLAAPHSDGWGIASYDEDGGVRLYKEAEPAATSDWVRYIQGRRLRSPIILSHIRRATQGGRALTNTQPFRREMGGRFHLFAHNGDLKGIPDSPLELSIHHPVGETDSEYAFCALLHLLAPAWSSGEPPSLEDRLAIVSRFAGTLRPLGPANFIYSDGEALFAHGHKRQGKDGRIRPPGLYLLRRRCHPTAEGFCVSGLEIGSGHEHPEEMVLAASVPLTGESWRPLEEGEIVAIRRGRVSGEQR